MSYQWQFLIIYSVLALTNYVFNVTLIIKDELPCVVDFNKLCVKKKDTLDEKEYV